MERTLLQGAVGHRARPPVGPLVSQDRPGHSLVCPSARTAVFSCCNSRPCLPYLPLLPLGLWTPIPCQRLAARSHHWGEPVMNEQTLALGGGAESAGRLFLGWQRAGGCWGPLSDSLSCGSSCLSSLQAALWSFSCKSTASLFLGPPGGTPRGRVPLRPHVERLWGTVAKGLRSCMEGQGMASPPRLPLAGQSCRECQA